MQTQQELKASRARYRELLDDLTGFYNTRYLYKPCKPTSTNVRSPRCRRLSRYRQIQAGGRRPRSSLQKPKHAAELAAVIKPLLPKGGYGVSYGGDELVADRLLDDSFLRRPIHGKRD